MGFASLNPSYNGCAIGATHRPSHRHSGAMRQHRTLRCATPRISRFRVRRARGAPEWRRC